MKKQLNITIDFTERDLEELMNGETFNWSYEAETGEMVNVHLYNSDLDNEDESGDFAHCADCDRVIDLDNDIWTADKNDTYCEICTKDRKIIARI